jgi:O-succinylbenzoic acid--CoA ligase
MRPRTIVALDEWLTQAARRRPDHPALDAEGRQLTYGELSAAAARTARRLAAFGVADGDRVATTLPPGLAFCELLHALPRLGAVLVPLDPRDPVRANARLTVTAPVTGHEADVRLRDTVDPDGVHSVIHTSGTTGRPKPVELTYGNHAASALASADGLGVDPDDRWLCPLPLHHVGGLGVLIRSVINRTTAVVHERFDAARVKDTLASGDVTLVSLVPTMLARLRDAGLRGPPGLRAIALGGGPIPASLLDWARAADIPAVPVYGMTETCSQVVAGSPGRPLRGVDRAIASDGEILVRGPMVARGELGVDGWLHTGDLGRIDAAGLLHVEGRLKELIVTGGENVAPLEVEQVLLAHPAVADAGVAGRPDPEWGEAVTAFVVLRRPASADELRAWCRERLEPYKTPKAVHEVAALPRNAGGKLLRDRL